MLAAWVQAPSYFLLQPHTPTSSLPPIMTANKEKGSRLSLVSSTHWTQSPQPVTALGSQKIFFAAGYCICNKRSKSQHVSASQLLQASHVWLEGYWVMTGRKVSWTQSSNHSSVRCICKLLRFVLFYIGVIRKSNELWELSLYANKKHKANFLQMTPKINKVVIRITYRLGQ